MTFQNCNTCHLNDTELSYFISNAQLDAQPQKVDLIYSFLNDMKYNINYGEKKSKRYCFIKELINQYKYREMPNRGIPFQQSQLGSGLNQYTPNRDKSSIYICLPQDPDEFVDHLKLIVLKKVGGNNNHMLNEQIIAIADEPLQYQCITPSQHQNLQSTSLIFQSKTFIKLEKCL